MTGDDQGAGPTRLLRLAAQRWLALPRALRLLLPIAIMGVLWWSSSQPAVSPVGVVRSFGHNAMHVVAWAALAAAFRFAFGPALLATPAPRATVAALLLSIAYGVVDELHQSHVPGRACSVVDVLSDALGAGLAVTVVDGVAARTWPRLRLWLLLLAAAVTVGWATFGG
ncbi:MAG: VanZ family protein [Planctomycetota bacterium]